MLISRSTAYLYDICAYYLAACTHDPGFQYSCRTNPRSFAKRREKFVTSPFFSPFIHVEGIIPVSGEIISSLSLFLSLSSTKEREVFDSLLFLPRQPESGRRARGWWSREREKEREVKNNVLFTLSASAIPYADSLLLRGRYVGN